MKKLFALLVAAMMCLSACAAMAEGTVTMGTNAAFAPFEYIGDDGKPTGFDVEIAQEIAKDLGKELVIEDMAFDGLLAAMDMGKVDFVIAAMTITEERLQTVNFSDPYYSDTQKVIVLKGYEGIKTVEDIKDKRVAVQDGTTGFLMAADTLGVPADRLSAFKSSPDTVMELLAGRVDCILIDNGPANVFLANNPELVLVEGLDMPVENYGIAVAKKNEDLLASINKTMARIQEDGTYAALIEKYFINVAE